jgi:hypothetical protein
VRERIGGLWSWLGVSLALSVSFLPACVGGSGNDAATTGQDQAMPAESPASAGSSVSPATVNSTHTPVMANAGLSIGAFTGGSNPSLAAKFETWLGRKSDYAVDFFSDTGYTGSDPMAGSASWVVGQWAAANRPDRNMLFSVPLSTVQDPSLRNVASGIYDAQFQQVAKSIAARYPNAIIRIGWEFNGNWYPWSAQGKVLDYINAFRRVSKLFTAVSPTFTIDWCPGLGTLSMPAENAYPGDDVVDVIGLDAYEDWRYSPNATSVQQWTYFRDQDHGLTWHQQFAAKHNKPMSFPEWAVNHDDSYFMQQMYSWITTNRVAYASYWSSNAGFAGDLVSLQYPGASATYKSLFSTIPLSHH